MSRGQTAGEDTKLEIPLGGRPFAGGGPGDRFVDGEFQQVVNKRAKCQGLGRRRGRARGRGFLDKVGKKSPVALGKQPARGVNRGGNAKDGICARMARVISVVQWGIPESDQGAVLEQAPGKVDDGRTGPIVSEVGENRRGVRQVELKGLCPLELYESDSHSPW